MNILLIDDHPIFGLGLEMFLAEKYPDVVIQRATTLAGGICALNKAQQHLPDLVLTDLELKQEARGLEALKAVRKSAPRITTVVVAGDQNPNLIREAIDNGASGYIPKTSDPEELSRALDVVVAGGVYLPPIALSREVIRAKDPVPHLTVRQTDVLGGLVRGLSNKEIARELHISDQTVKTHLKDIFQTLDVHNRTQAVYTIASLGLRLK